MTTTAIPDDARYLRKTSAAAYLDCSIDTVDRMVADGILTPRKLRGQVRFDRQEIDAYMTGRRRTRRAS